MLSVVLTDRCYSLVKKYVDYIQSQDNLVRDITENYLYAYCFIHGYPNFNNGIYHLIEQAMTQLTIDELKKELGERKQKIINNQLQLVSRLK